MFVWADDADDAAQERGLRAGPGPRRRRPGSSSVTIGENVGPMKTDYDWILDVHVTDDRTPLGRCSTATLYTEVMRAVAPVTKYEWTARLSHEIDAIVTARSSRGA